MKKYILMLNNFLLGFCVFAQPSLQEIHAYIHGTWEGTIPVTGKVKLPEYPYVHAQYLIDVSLEFQKIDSKFHIKLLRKREAKLIEPKETKDPTLLVLLNAQRVYEMFIKDIAFEAKTFSVLHPIEEEPILSLNISIDTSNSGTQRLDYLKKDFRRIRIKEISAQKMYLLIPSRTNWDDSLEEYTKTDFVEIEFSKVVKP